MALESSVRSVERAFNLLLTLEQFGRPLRLSDLARASDIHIATAQRLLAVLEKRSLVERDELGYRIGPAAVPLAYAFFQESDLTKAAFPVLQELASTSLQTVTMYVRVGFGRVVIQRIEGKNPLRYILPIGQRIALHLGAGKVLCAAMSQAELAELLDLVGEIRLASGSVRSREEYMAELDLIRQQGFAVAVSERTVGVASVAAPVVRRDGTTVACIAVTGLASSMTPEVIAGLCPDLRRAGQAISQMYGGNR